MKMLGENSCHLECWVCSQKLQDSSGNTVAFVRFSLEYTVVLLGRLALLAGRLFRSVLSRFLAGTHARVATSDLNEFFKICQIWMPFQQFSQKTMKMKQSAVFVPNYQSALSLSKESTIVMAFRQISVYS